MVYNIYLFLFPIYDRNKPLHQIQTRKKIRVPDRIWTHNPPYNGRMLEPSELLRTLWWAMVKCGSLAMTASPLESHNQITTNAYNSLLYHTVWHKADLADIKWMSEDTNFKLACWKDSPQVRTANEWKIFNKKGQIKLIHLKTPQICHMAYCY